MKARRKGRKEAWGTLAHEDWLMGSGYHPFPNLLQGGRSGNKSTAMTFERRRGLTGSEGYIAANFSTMWPPRNDCSMGI